MVRAIQKVVDHSVQIGRALGLPDDRLGKIGWKHSQDRKAIAIIDSWLRGTFNQGARPYTLHSEEKYRCPSWWNLVWAVAHNTGGNNPRHALTIAESYESKICISTFDLCEYYCIVWCFRVEDIC